MCWLQNPRKQSGTHEILTFHLTIEGEFQYVWYLLFGLWYVIYRFALEKSLNCLLFGDISEMLGTLTNRILSLCLPFWDKRFSEGAYVHFVGSSGNFTYILIFLLKKLLRARLVDYLFPMSKVLKIRVGRSGKKKKRKKKKKRQKYL